MKRMRIRPRFWWFLAILILVCMILCSGGKKPAEAKITIPYTVSYGDTLYDIAAEYGIDEWEKWVYETRKANGLTEGIVYEGQTIMIEVNAE